MPSTTKSACPHLALFRGKHSVGPRFAERENYSRRGCRTFGTCLEDVAQAAEKFTDFVQDLFYRDISTGREASWREGV